MTKFIELYEGCWFNQNSIRQFYMKEESLLVDLGSEMVRIDEPDEIKRVLAELLNKE